MGLRQRHKPQHPHRVKVSPWGVLCRVKIHLAFTTRQGLSPHLLQRIEEENIALKKKVATPVLPGTMHFTNTNEQRYRVKYL